MGVHVFLMDPIESIDIHGDSTFVLMLEAQARGHEVLYGHPSCLELDAGRPFVCTQEIQVWAEEGNHFSLGANRRLCLDDATVVYMRKDPPFNLDYLVATYILDRTDRSRVVMVNDPQALRDLNEKLSALMWPHLMPRTLITSDRQRIRALIDEIGEVVVKPLMSAGGTGIVHLAQGDRNIGSVLDLLTEDGRRVIEAQAYLPNISKGDKRIILLDGEPFGVVNRVPRGDDIRANMHVGGTAEAAQLDQRDRQICAEVGPELCRRGVIFAGIDVIDGWLTEINLTSPTGLQEINRFDGVKLEAQILDRIEAKCRALGVS